MNEQISLYNQDTDAFIGTISKDQFDVLTYYLKLAGDDVKQAENHKMNLRMLDIIEREAQRFAAEGQNLPNMGKAELGTRAGTRAVNMVDLVALIRAELGGGDELTIRWQEV